MKELLIIGQAVFLAASFLAPKTLAAKDAIQIQANGNLDTLKADWHKFNVQIRFLMFGPLTLLAVAPPIVLINTLPIWLMATGLALASLALNVSFHWIVFDRELNRLRGLAFFYHGVNSKFDVVAAKNPNVKRRAFIFSVVAYLVCLLLLIKYLQ